MHAAAARPGLARARARTGLHWRAAPAPRAQAQRRPGEASRHRATTSPAASPHAPRMRSGAKDHAALPGRRTWAWAARASRSARARPAARLPPARAARWPSQPRRLCPPRTVSRTRCSAPAARAARSAQRGALSAWLREGALTARDSHGPPPLAGTAQAHALHTRVFVLKNMNSSGVRAARSRHVRGTAGLLRRVRGRARARSCSAVSSISATTATAASTRSASSSSAASAAASLTGSARGRRPRIRVWAGEKAERPALHRVTGCAQRCALAPWQAGSGSGSGGQTGGGGRLDWARTLARPGRGPPGSGSGGRYTGAACASRPSARSRLRYSLRRRMSSPRRRTRSADAAAVPASSVASGAAGALSTAPSKPPLTPSLGGAETRKQSGSDAHSRWARCPCAERQTTERCKSAEHVLSGRCVSAGHAWQAAR